MSSDNKITQQKPLIKKSNISLCNNTMETKTYSFSNLFKNIIYFYLITNTLYMVKHKLIVHNDYNAILNKY